MFDLVDVNGKRVRVKAVTTLGTISMESKKRFSETLPIIKYKEILNRHRIVKITKIDGEDYVEIVHDSLCPIIAKRREMRLAEEAKERNERLLREQTKKMRKRLTLFSLLALVVIGLVALFLRLNKRNQIAEQNLNLTKRSLILSESEKDSIQKQKEKVLELNDALIALNQIYEIQKDSLKELTLSLHEKNHELERSLDQLREQKTINKQQETQLAKMQTILNAYNACIFMRDAIANNDIDAIKRSADNFKSSNIISFNSLRCKDDIIPSLNGHVVFDDVFATRLANGEDVYNHSDEISRSAVHRGQISDGLVLAKTCMVEARKSCKYTFSSKGHQEIALIAESGGMVTLRIHVSNSKGLDAWYNDTVDVKKGQPQRMASFDLPLDCRNNVELEIINCGQKDISFVVLSN